MKSLDIIPKNIEEENILNEQGQTLVEFILLLVVIMGISTLYMRTINSNMGNYWEAMANTLMSDVPDAENIRIR